MKIPLKKFKQFEDWNYQDATFTQLQQVSELLGLTIQSPTTLAITQDPSNAEQEKVKAIF